MNTVFIVNFVGQASPATIKELAAITHENAGKWLISKVNFIEDQVAGVIKIELPKENADIVKDAFSACQSLIEQTRYAERTKTHHRALQCCGGCPIDGQQEEKKKNKKDEQFREQEQ